MSIEQYQQTYIQNVFADRIGGANYGKDTNIYKFEKIKRAKAAAKLAHPDVELIDMGVGEPDEMADAGIVAKLAEQQSLRIAAMLIMGLLNLRQLRRNTYMRYLV